MTATGVMDEESLIVIERFKEALLPKVVPCAHDSVDFVANRGNKLELASCTESLRPKIVEYNGQNHLVYTNEGIERSTSRKRRKWRQTYGPVSSADGSSVDMLAASDDDSETDENPFKDIKLSDILAPLNHPLELVSHPAILKTYALNVYSRLAGELIDLIEVEQNNLNQLNKLLYVLNGEDWHYLLEDKLGLANYNHDLIKEKSPGPGTKTEKPDSSPSATPTDAALPDTANSTDLNAASPEKSHVGEGTIEASEEVSEKALEKASENGLDHETQDKPSKTHTPAPETIAESGDCDPFFALPAAFKDYELRGVHDADSDKETTIIQEDLINYLQVSVQRQYEYIKNLTKIRNAVVRAERLKKNLIKWGKEMHDTRSS